MFHRRDGLHKVKRMTKHLKGFILLNMMTINRRIFSKQQKTYPNLTLSKMVTTKGDHSSNFDRLPFRPGSAYTPVSYDLVFLLPCRLKKKPPKRVSDETSLDPISRAA